MRTRALSALRLVLGATWPAFVAVAGCSLPTSVTGVPIDGAGGDGDAFVGTMDVGPAMDTGTDAFVLAVDGGIDAFTPVDSGVDAFTPPSDAGTDAFVAVDVGADANASPTCDGIYGGLTSYQLCGSDATSCRFYLQLGSGTSCDDICGMSGHTCLAEIDNNSSSHCTSMGGAQTCSHNFGDGICTCSFP